MIISIYDDGRIIREFCFDGAMHVRFIERFYGRYNIKLYIKIETDFICGIIIDNDDLRKYAKIVFGV